MTRHYWSEDAYNFFVKEGMLTDVETFILKTRIKGWTITKQADALGYSVDNVNKIIANIKKKYDFIQKRNPILPPRRKSAKESYMDTH